MARKISVLDRIFKSGKSNIRILKTAFLELDSKTLQTFSKIMYTKFPFNTQANVIESLENRKIEQFNGIIPEYIRNADNEKIFNYSLGILHRNREKISKFIKHEESYVKSLLFNSYLESNEQLNQIESEFGISYWSITQRKNLEHLNNVSVDVKYSSKHYNNLDDILIKVHQNNLDEIESGTLIEAEPLGPEGLKNEIYSFINYRIFGLNSREENIDIFHVLKTELNSTLIDFFKAFETLCYITLTEIFNGFEKYTTDIKNYLDSIDHYLLRNIIQSTEMDDCIKKIYDNYTESNYKVVIQSLKNNMEIDTSRFKLLSKSLYYENSRLSEDNFYHKQANLMADIYSKNENFHIAASTLSNLSLAFRGILIYNIIRHRIVVESKGCFNRSESYVLKSEIILSRDNTPLKKMIVSTSPYNVDELQYEGATEKLFMKRNLISIAEANEREIKYHIIELIKENKIKESSCYLLDNYNYKDNELSQIYVKVKSMTGEIEKACDYFLKLYIKSPAAVNYFITSEFYSVLELHAKNAQNIITAICLYICKDSYVDKKMNKNATGIAIGRAIRSLRIRHPSEIIIEEGNWMHGFFLSDVCEKDLLTKSLLYRTQSEAYDERIKICNILVSNKLGNQDKLLNESKMLSKRKVLEVAEKQINSSKIYADKDYIINNVWDQLNSLYKDVIDKKTNYDNTLDNEIERVINNIDLEKLDVSTVTSMGFSILPAHLIQYAALGRDHKMKAIFQMLKIYTEEYCFGLKGLNTYLSTRIRHGTLESTITSHLVSNGFMPADGHDEDKQFYNILKDTDSSITSLIKQKRIQFKERLYVIINEIINDWVQICFDIPPPTLQEFNFYFNQADLIKLARKIESSQSFNECCGYLDETIEEKLLLACSKITSNLDIKSRQDIINIFNDFEGYLYDIQSDNNNVIPFEFNRLVTSSKQHVLNQLDVIINWFKLKQDFQEQSYDMEIILGIIKNMVQVENIKLVDDYKIKITYDVLSATVDIFYNLVNNAIKYSNLHPSEVNIEILCKVNIEDKKVSIEVINDCIPVTDYIFKNEGLKKYSEPISSEDLKMLMQREGGNTGIARVKSAIRYELNSREEVSLCYLSETNFSATASFKSARGLSYEKNINN
ncbi:hypothetical protein ACN09D_12280 [Serratia fonticola]|uniref:hypothetical protein n=1 Tax=Serratia fonticola TaxID=47917 RepID=UPI003AF3EB7C